MAADAPVPPGLSHQPDLTTARTRLNPEFSPLPNPAHGLDAADIDRQIHLLIRNLVEIKDTSGEFLLKLDDGRVIDTKGWNDWEWTHGVGLYGIWKFYQQTQDARCRQIMLDWFRDRFAVGPPTKNINTVAPFLTLAYLHEETPNPAWLPYLDEWAEWVMKGLPRTEESGFQHIVFNSENHQQLWDDTLMMSVMTLAKIGKVLGRPRYVEEARRQFMLHVKYLVDRKSGLWFHGWTFDGRHHFANALWARGNCWVTIAIPEFIELLDLQSGDALREFLLETHLQQIRTLVKHQDPGGLWHTLIDDPDSYLEASATAGFAYGILKSVRKGYIGGEYLDAGMRAVKAVLANIDATGELKNVSFGTPVFNDLDGYRNIPLTSMPYGQAMAILALGELKRTFT
jgi:unsaturated rhamnogalacturonyl hydrolase